MKVGALASAASDSVRLVRDALEVVIESALQPVNRVLLVPKCVFECGVDKDFRFVLNQVKEHYLMVVLVVLGEYKLFYRCIYVQQQPLGDFALALFESHKLVRMQ